MLRSINEAWSPRINFVLRGAKPTKRRLPGLRIVVHGCPPCYAWRCCLNRLFSN